MRFLRINLILIVYICSYSLRAGETWNPYSGKKTWKEAKAHCIGLGMRLPTEKEIAYAFQSGLTKKWNGGETKLWTDKENASLNLKNHFNIYTKDSILGFSCLDSSFSLTESQGKILPIISKWIFSEHLGEMVWDDANKKCSSSGMRLPTIAELKEAYDSKITKSWQKDGNGYWSSTPYDAERYYCLDVDDRDTYHYDRNFNRNVRCRRLSPPSVSY
jgi:formylglycine-generating enzyme required for sulfatase activity